MWLYEGKEFTEIPPNIVGFVYRITNTLDGREYIGKKLFTKAGYKQVRGKRKKLRKPSDWKDYYGSNKELVADVVQFGGGNFVREILLMCETRGLCSYHEARLQFAFHVLEHPEKYYNGQIQCRIHRSHLKLKK